jgi:hypothetical protein
VNIFTFRSVTTGAAGVQIEVPVSQVNFGGTPVADLITGVLGRKEARSCDICISLTEDEAIDLLTWLRRWEQS